MTDVRSDIDFQRAQEAVRRGWLTSGQVADCLDERGTAQSILDALAARGWLNADQVRRLQAATVSIGSPPAGDPRLEEDEVLRVGDAISGRFEIERILPPGGFGRVYVCRTRDTRQRVALKTPLRKYVRSKEHLDMFRAEVIRWIGLGVHPNIVLAYGHEEQLRLPFIVMELIEDGRTLQSVVSGSGADWKNALRYGLQIARGLDHAGRRSGLIHRDLKPGNVMVTPDGTAKVTDFGLSLVREAADDIVVGTPPYMPPEQWTSPKSVDVRSDVYPFGVILFELAAGRRPFPDHRTWEEYRDDHLNRMVPDPRLLRPEIPERLARLILSCLEKEQDDRPDDFASLSRELENLHVELVGPAPEELMATPVPTDVERLVNDSATYHQLGKFDEALRTAEEALRIYPSHANAHVSLGNALVDIGRRPEGIRSLLSARRLDPASVYAAVNLARAYFVSGNAREAKAWLSQALSLAQDAGSYHLLDKTSWLFVEVESPELALSVFGRILENDPNALLTWNMQAILLRRLGRFPEALACADRTVELNPGYAKGWSNRASILVQMGRPAEAIRSAETAIGYEPATTGAYAAKAMALRDLGRSREARACLEAGLRAVPGSPILVQALGTL